MKRKTITAIAGSVVAAGGGTYVALRDTETPTPVTAMASRPHGCIEGYGILKTLCVGDYVVRPRRDAILFQLADWEIQGRTLEEYAEWTEWMSCPPPDGWLPCPMPAEETPCRTGYQIYVAPVTCDQGEAM